MAIKALLVGINYTTKPYLRLNGCVNDVLAAREYLQVKHAAKPEHIKLMIDQLGQQGEGYVTPSKNNIMEGLTTLLKSGQAGDVLLFHFSGHGTQVFNKEGTPSLHEALVPLDAKDVGSRFDNVIHDYELEKVISDNTPANVTLYLVFDCCFGGGEMEKQGTRLRSLSLPQKTFGSQIRLAIPRDFEKQGYLSSLSSIPSSSSHTLASSLQNVMEKKKNDITLVSFFGCAKNEPAVDATFNYKDFGAFSYYFYNILQSSGLLQNMKVLDSVKDGIKKANFNQNPQIITSRNEQINKWNCFTHQEGDPKYSAVMLHDIISFSGFNKLMEMTEKEIEEMKLLDNSANMEIHQNSRCIGKQIPFAIQDIARVFAVIAGRTVLKMNQMNNNNNNNTNNNESSSSSSSPSLSLSAPNLAIRKTVRGIFKLLFPDPINGKRPLVKQPELFDLINNVVIPVVNKVLGGYLPDVKKELVERTVFNSISISLPHIRACLTPSLDTVIQLTEMCNQINIKSRDISTSSVELVKQTVLAIVASDINKLNFNNKKFSNLPDFSREICNFIEGKFNDTSMAQWDNHKLVMAIVRDIAKNDRTTLEDQDFRVQDLQDRVFELTTRFNSFIAPMENRSQPSSPTNIPLPGFSSDQVMKMTMQILQIYNKSPHYREDMSKEAVMHAMDTVLSYPKLHGYPESFISELAKTAGNIAAKFMMAPNANPSQAVTLAIAVVAQLMIPYNNNEYNYNVTSPSSNVSGDVNYNYGYNKEKDPYMMKKEGPNVGNLQGNAAATRQAF